MGDERPLAVIDSGVGGLSVLREVARQLPCENLLYLADTANCPYGPRSPDEIRTLAEGIVRFLGGQGAKLVVVACNTMSAAALAHLRARSALPIVGMVPAVKPAAAETNTGVVGVIATEATIQGELFAELVQRYASNVRVLTQTCPGLVQQVEAGALDGGQTEALLHRYLDPMLGQGIDELVLGCTHYPFLTPAIRRVVGDRVTIIDPSPAIARQTGRVLGQHRLQRSEGGGRPFRIYYTTGRPVTFRRLLRRLLGEDGDVRQALWQDGELAPG